MTSVQVHRCGDGWRVVCSTCGTYDQAGAQPVCCGQCGMRARPPISLLNALLTGQCPPGLCVRPPAGALDVALANPYVALQIAQMAAVCDVMKFAANYVEVEYTVREKRYLVTFQDLHRPTPHQLREQAEGALRAVLAECETAIARAMQHDEDEVPMYATTPEWVLVEDIRDLARDGLRDAIQDHLRTERVVVV